MIRKSIILMTGLMLIMAGRLCFADDEGAAPTSQGAVNPVEQMSEQVDPTAVIAPPPEQMSEEAAPTAVIVQQSEQMREQAAPIVVMAQQSEQAAPIVVMARQSKQQREQVAPTAVMVNPSMTAVKQGYSSQVTRALPSMNVSIAGVKGTGLKPQSVKAASAVAFQATQKK